MFLNEKNPTELSFQIFFLLLLLWVWDCKTSAEEVLFPVSNKWAIFEFVLYFFIDYQNAGQNFDFIKSKNSLHYVRLLFCYSFDQYASASSTIHKVIFVILHFCYIVLNDLSCSVFLYHSQNWRKLSFTKSQKKRSLLWKSKTNTNL